MDDGLPWDATLTLGSVSISVEVLLTDFFFFFNIFVANEDPVITNNI